LKNILDRNHEAASGGGAESPEGKSLTEILLVFAIIGILTSFLLPMIAGGFKGKVGGSAAGSK
jgi:Tfp pilus assembly protein FimT